MGRADSSDAFSATGYECWILVLVKLDGAASQGLYNIRTHNSV